MNDFDFTGTHVLCDISAVAPELIENDDHVLKAVLRGIEASGATLCGTQSKKFEPLGVTAVFVLSESHVSVHTYPERCSLFVDAFTCGTTCDPERIVHEVLRALGPCETRTSVIHRGTPARSLTSVVGAL
ncbi:adenosylmethionine decarboxylase [Nocardiopsis sp. NRRL B-16309]|uniref:adenosylmethionine decarboxylase n=1 Tax=Nocardiopsis sp. NRRL B-16309 TaxID=1519494 RepID=UPI0006AEC7FA|nr:adenosylmethionine decarboxylase [Nocardiopsis sp. NRRL B-16309]